MVIIPAIDIKGGKCVRLRQGRLKECTEYNHNPEEVAQHWTACGAQRLHVVDLDGAFSGKLENHKTIEKIRRKVSVAIQVGGGIRSMETADYYCGLGIDQIVLGTSVLENPGFLEAVCQKYPEKVIVAIDSRKGKIATKGWVNISGTRVEHVLPRLAVSGVKAIIFTDIQKDGMLSGPNTTEIRSLVKSSSVPFIASGGVTTLSDIESLMTLEDDGLIGIIVGKALYEGRLDLRSVLNFVLEKGNARKENHPLS